MESIPCSFHILDLIDQIKAMQQTITYLKLNPQQRADQARLQAEERVEHSKALVEEITTAAEEIKNHRDLVAREVQTAFNHLQEILIAREKHLLDEVDRVADQSISKYRALEEEALEELNRATRKQEEILSKQPSELTEADMNFKPCHIHIPLPEFNLKFLCDEDAAISAIQKVGKVGKWRVAAPYECSHFSNVTYWMLPPCCYTYYCCNKCHDNTEMHPWQYATRMVCMYCNREQDYRKLPNVCEGCTVAHKGVISK